MQLSKILGYPFALMYGGITNFRNYLYDTKFFKSVRFDIPVISVGNLSVGGTGKTPHIEYLIRLIGTQKKVGTLSRGYKRKTIGFRMADPNSTAADIGDEPLQFYVKYRNIRVAVSEDRSLGIPNMLSTDPSLEVILLDDAFQHRTVKPGLNILLTDYQHLFTRDEMLPVGNLREYPKGYKRAHFIVVTKCLQDLSAEKRSEIIEEIKPLEFQKIFFSKLNYLPLYPFFRNDLGTLSQLENVLLISGIANNEGLKQYVEGISNEVFEMKFPDHHVYSIDDMEKLDTAFNNIPGENKVIVTTEKDAMRLIQHREWISERQLPIWCQPIEVDFFEEDKVAFDHEIRKYLYITENFES